MQYQQQRVFRSTHELVQRLLQLCITQPPPVAKEVDLDLRIVAERATQPQLAERVTQPQPMPAAPPVTPPPAEARRRSSRVAAAATALTPAKSEVHSLTPPSIPTAQARRSLSLLEPRSASGKAGRGGVQMRATPFQPTASRSQAVRRALSTVPVAGTPLSPADLAAHGPLYDNITFGNIPQWVAMCTLPFNAYRLASQRNDRAAQNQAVEDILMLPQRVLTRTSRGGGDGKRLTRTIRARCRARGEELRRKYQCMPPRDDTAQLRGKGETEPLVHRAAAAEPLAPLNAQAEPSTARDMAQAGLSPDATASAAATESAQADNDADGDDGGDDYDGDYARAFTQAANGMPVDPDRKAAKRAQWQVKRGHMQHAARTLHSTATMADLRSEQVRQAVEALHPALPATSVIPPLPADAPQQILEDDEEMVTLLRRSDNGSASGPSGWGGNMLSSLAQSDLCRAGIIALLKDILNGNLPDRARELLLASRLVALTKTEGKYRPIAVGELFPRLAGKLAMNKVTSAAAALLAPHQLGVGVPCGAERIVHSLQHTLTDVNSRHALLKVDIANAFNTCDRARVLRLLYEQPALSALYRMADFAYSSPSQLLLQGCEGQSLLSANGVRQGDALSALLFCLYLRDTLAEVSQIADVQLHAFCDDVNVSGEPAEVVKALHALQQKLPAIGLQLNTAKSHCAYFHEAEAPLQRSVLTTLAELDIQMHDDWLEVVGAVVGRDEDAIRKGVAAKLDEDEGTAAFFHRLQLDELNVQSAILILRQCAVPKMHYALRCTPPPCIAQAAAAFDVRVIDAAAAKLRLHTDEVSGTTAERLCV